MLPDEVKIRIYDQTVDLIARTAERVLDNRRIGNRIRRIAVNQRLEPAIEAALLRAIHDDEPNPGSSAKLAGVADTLVSSAHFQRAIEDVIRRPWEVTEETYEQLGTLVRDLTGEPAAEPMTEPIRLLLVAVARELWQEPEVRDLYNIYFQQRLVEIGAEQLASQRETQALLAEISSGVTGPHRGDFVLSEATANKELEDRRSQAARQGQGSGAADARQLLERYGRRLVSGSRSLRVRDLLRSTELFQRTTAVCLDDEHSQPLPALDLIEQRILRNGEPILLLGEGGLGKTTTALAFTYRQLERGRPTQYVDLSIYRGNVSDHRFGSKEWAVANIPFVVAVAPEDQLLVLDAVDELLSGLSYEQAKEICGCWLLQSAALLCCRRSFYDRVLGWTSLARNCELLELTQWNVETIDRYAYTLLSTTRPDSADEIYAEFSRWLQGDRRFAELCAIPLRLTMLLELRNPFRFAGDVNMLKNLYDTYVLEYLRYESARVGSTLSAPDKARVLEDVAWDFFDELSHGYGEERSFTVERVTELLDKHEMTRLWGNGVRDDILFGSLLRIRHADSLATSGSVMFQHKSFQEFFVARRINAQVLSGQTTGLPDAFSVLFSPEVSEFIKEFIADINVEPRLRWLAFQQLARAFQLTTDHVDDSRIRIARQQIGYYLGNLRLQQARDWVHRQLQIETDPWIARGMAVGLAFGGDDSALHRYLDQLKDELAADGPRPHNEVNVGFHLTFFGDQPVDAEHPEVDQGNPWCAKTIGGLLYQLSTQTDRGSWRLNIYTLCYLFSHARTDLKQSAAIAMAGLKSACVEILTVLRHDDIARQWPETGELSEILRTLDP